MSELEAVKKARPADVKRLEALHARLERHAAAGDVGRYYEENYLFHEAIEAVAANPWLSRTVGELRRFLRLLRGRQLRVPGRMEASLAEHRRLMRALRPIYLEDLGLVTALEMLVNETSQANHLDVKFQPSGKERRLSREVELAFYRIAQEAMNNIVHHANAKHANVQLAFNKEIKLEVMDDGIGFNIPKSPTDFAPSGHFGLLGIRERADLIGAKLEVQSAQSLKGEAGHGTRVLVHLPFSSRQPRKKAAR